MTLCVPPTKRSRRDFPPLFLNASSQFLARFGEYYIVHEELNNIKIVCTNTWQQISAIWSRLGANFPIKLWQVAWLAQRQDRNNPLLTPNVDILFAFLSSHFRVSDHSISILFQLDIEFHRNKNLKENLGRDFLLIISRQFALRFLCMTPKTLQKHNKVNVRCQILYCSFCFYAFTRFWALFSNVCPPLEDIKFWLVANIIIECCMASSR